MQGLPKDCFWLGFPLPRAYDEDSLTASIKDLNRMCEFFDSTGSNASLHALNFSVSGAPLKATSQTTL
jgi:hypothetical protein